MMEESPASGIADKPGEDHLRSRFPVHRACRDGDADALSGLLAHGEHDLYTEDWFYSGWTPAHWAAYHGKLECLQLLLTAGVNLDVATQRFHQTPTHIAAFGNQPHCLIWLTQSGASLDAQDYLGETAVHKAARIGGVECLGILKASGATFSIVNNNGHTAKDLAMSCSNEPCAAYIQQVEGAPHIANGFGGGHSCRKRGTDEMCNGAFKKPRIEENGHDAFPKQHVNGAENFQASNGLSVSSVSGDSAPSICSSGIQATPTSSLMHASHPQERTPQRLMYRITDFEENHSQQQTPMQTDHTQENGFKNNMDGVNNHNCATNENVAVSVSTSAMEHHATVAMATGYNQLCESAYSTQDFCHFF